MPQAPDHLHELLILRHGKSDWSRQVSDFDRPLKNRGKRNAQQIGNWLAEQHLQPDLILCSPAVRALNTAEKACKAMGLSCEIVCPDERLYDASWSDCLGVLTELSETVHRVMLVGHNPELEDLLMYLGQSIVIPSDSKLLPTATVAQLVIQQRWATLGAHQAILQALIRPKTLTKLFPFVSNNGIEERIRPAYYYTQSAVIPYRIVAHKLEILLIRSSADKHWIVPKGIIEPGLSPQQSAQKEALEEAGITGINDNDCLGKYRYKKWAAYCSVEVYAMRVTHELAESQRQEQHRQRLWVSVEIAIQRLDQVALHPMIKKLQGNLGICHA